MLRGIDVSYAQSTIDWKRVKATGEVGFAYSRVCYGTNPADDDGETFVANHDACKTLSIPFGSYCFWIAGQDGKAQAAHYLEAANGRYGNCFPMVDVEEGSGVEGWGSSLDERIDNLGETLDAIEKAVAKPIIYTNADTWETQFAGTDAFSGYTLWVASYGTVPGNPIMPGGWTQWGVHQYTSGGIIDGINGFVDLDVAQSLSVLLR